MVILSSISTLQIERVLLSPSFHAHYVDGIYTLAHVVILCIPFELFLKLNRSTLGL
jgi:hypothetical protein